MSVAGIAWSRTAVVLALAALLAAARKPGAAPREPGTTWIAIAGLTLLTLYGAITARETCGDLLFHWGPKAARFHLARGIDTSFLALPQNFALHADYPPLLPLLYDWAAALTQRFSWWGAVLTLPLFFVATIAAFRGIARRRIGHRSADMHALLLAAVLAFAGAVGFVAGAADPPLILFGVTAMTLLTFADDDRGAIFVASIAVAGAAFTKVEGAALAVVIVAAFGLTRRRFTAAAALIAPAAALVGAWILFARHFHLLDAYLVHQPAKLSRLAAAGTLTARFASYQSFYLPWLAAAVPLALGRNYRRAALPLLATAGWLAAILYFYLHEPDPTLLIALSAHRLLIMALAFLVVASAAASE
jgi:hypothetical protein